MNKRFLIGMAMALSAFAPLRGRAVEPYASVIADPVLEPWRWRHEEALEGLGALCMDKAADGSFWFGCAGSIARYDGRTVSQIHFDEDFLSRITAREESPWAKALLLLEDGSFLALIGESLVLRSGDTWSVLIQDVGPTVFFSSLVKANDGTVWLQVKDGLWRVSLDFKDISRVINASGKTVLTSFCIDLKGDVWVVERAENAEQQLIRIPVENGVPARKQAWIFNPVPFQNDTGTSRILADSDGLIWYADGSRFSGLEAFDPEKKRWFEPERNLQGLGVYSLVRSRDGIIRAGAEGLIASYSKGTGYRLYSMHQLDLPQVPLSLFDFGDDRLWIIGRIGQVYSVDLGTDEWLTYAGLNFQCETDDGVQWFLSKQVNRVVSHDLRSNEWKQYGPEDDLIDWANVLIRSSHGLVWVAGRHENRAAIAVFDGARWRRFLHPEFAVWIEPHAAFEADDGTLWFGAGGPVLTDHPNAGGALQYIVDDGGGVRLLEHHAKSDFPYYVTSFAQTPDGTIWVGSTRVHAYDGSSPSPPAVLPYPRDNTVDMVADRKQTLWAAKEYSGIYQFQNGEWKAFTTQDGLAGQTLSSLLLLSDGSLLAASDKGISRFDGKTWIAQAYSQAFAMSKRWSGMRESADGSIWLNYVSQEAPSARDIANKTELFRTIRHRPEATPPDTRITDYLERVAQPGNSHISWTAHDPWGETKKGLLQYSWCLDSGEWSAFSSQTSKTFLDLDHGRHRLEVRARDRAFNVDPTPDQVDFLVVAPLWLQPWFIAMVMLMVGGTILLIWMMVYFHEKRLKDRAQHLIEMDQVKTSFFTNISHELRTPLSVMLSPLESLLRSENDGVKKEKLSMVIRSAERVSSLLTQLLDFRKIEQGKMTLDLAEGDVVEPVRATLELLQPLAQARRVHCRFESPAEYPGFFDEDKLRKITSNLIGNAIKYTRPGGEVVVRLAFSAGRAEKDWLILMVEDSGAGIEPEHLEHIFDRFFRGSEKTAVDGSGIGLNFAKELVALWGGEIRAESPIHRDAERPGTRFVVELPIGGNGDLMGSGQ